MNASILYITYDGLTSQIGQSQVLPYIRGLAGRGHRMSVLSFERRSELESRGAAVEADLAERGIRWHPRQFRARPPLVAKAIDLIDANRTARRLVAAERFDIVHCRSYVAADVGLRLKKRFGTRFLFDMRGFWADQKREGGHWPAGHPLYDALHRRWKAKESAFVAEADEIVVLAEAARAEVEGWPAWGGAPITVIPCSLDFDRFRLSNADERAEARRALGIAQDARVLVYLGSLGTVYLLKEMLTFFSALKRRDPRWMFLLVGKHDEAGLLETAHDAGIEIGKGDLRIVESPHSDVAYWLGSADLAIAFYVPTGSSKGVSPTKLGEYLAAGLPVIMNKGVGDVQAIVMRFDAGLVLGDIDPQALMAAAADVEPYLDRPRQGLRERSRNFHEIKSAVDQYDAIYRRLRGSE